MALGGGLGEAFLTSLERPDLHFFCTVSFAWRLVVVWGGAFLTTLERPNLQFVCNSFFAKFFLHGAGGGLGGSFLTSWNDQICCCFFVCTVFFFAVFAWRRVVVWGGLSSPVGNDHICIFVCTVCFAHFFAWRRVMVWGGFPHQFGMTRFAVFLRSYFCMALGGCLGGGFPHQFGTSRFPFLFSLRSFFCMALGGGLGGASLTSWERADLQFFYAGIFARRRVVVWGGFPHQFGTTRFAVFCLHSCFLHGAKWWFGGGFPHQLERPFLHSFFLHGGGWWFGGAFLTSWERPDLQFVFLRSFLCMAPGGGLGGAFLTSFERPDLQILYHCNILSTWWPPHAAWTPPGRRPDAARAPPGRHPLAAWTPPRRHQAHATWTLTQTPFRYRPNATQMSNASFCIAMFSHATPESFLVELTISPFWS